MGGVRYHVKHAHTVDGRLNEKAANDQGDRSSVTTECSEDHVEGVGDKEEELKSGIDKRALRAQFKKAGQVDCPKVGSVPQYSVQIVLVSLEYSLLVLIYVCGCWRAWQAIFSLGLGELEKSIRLAGKCLGGG